MTSTHSTSPSLPTIEQLLPHRDGMLLLRSLETLDGDVLVASGWIPTNCPVASDGLAPAMLAVELAAQATAALEALGARGVRDLEALPPSDTRDAPEAAPPAQDPSQGYLVTLREVQMQASTVAVGDELCARVERQGQAGPLAMYEVRVWRRQGGDEVLRGRLSTWSLSSS